MEWEEEFSKDNPVEIKDTDVFLHGTSSERYLAIKKEGFLLRKVKDKNFSISQKGIYFEKYDEHGTYAGGSAAKFVEDTIRDHCKKVCENDQSSEGVILQIKGRELRKLGCPIYADWNKSYGNAIITDSEGTPIGLNSNVPVLSIIIVDKDIPLEYLEVVRRMPFKD